MNSTNPKNPVAEILRALARPAVTIIFAVAIYEIVVYGIDAPQWFLGLAIPCIVWWFGERTYTHRKEKKEEQGK